MIILEGVPQKLDTMITTDANELSKFKAKNLFQKLNMFVAAMFIWTEIIVELIKDSQMVGKDKNNTFNVDGANARIKMAMFGYCLQQPTNKLSNPDCFKIVEALNTN